MEWPQCKVNTLSNNCLTNTNNNFHQFSEIVHEIQASALKKNIKKSEYAVILQRRAEEEGSPVPPLPTDAKKGRGKPRKFQGPSEDGRKAIIKFVEDWEPNECSNDRIRRYIIEKLTYAKGREKKKNQ